MLESIDIIRSSSCDTECKFGNVGCPTYFYETKIVTLLMKLMFVIAKRFVKGEGSCII